MRVGWELILVPLIAMVVAVLASIFRGAEEARRRQNQRPGGEPRRERSRSDGSGIDQFLEEIRRRQAARQTQREMRRPPIEPGPEAAVEERPMPVEPPPPQRRREPRREAPVVAAAVVVPSIPIASLPEL